MNEDEKWFRGCRNFKPKQSGLEHWELQNKLKFIKIGSQKAEIVLKAGKILIIYSIMKRSHQDTITKWEWEMMRKWGPIKY